MSWILVGTLLGSVITSSHDTREACEGRAVLLREKNAGAKCVEMPSGYSGTITLTPGSNITLGAQR